MKYPLALLLALILTGCATGLAPRVEWVATLKMDAFTDQKTCSVTVGSLYTRNSVYSYTNLYYPYIDVVNGDIRVGIKSGGKYKIPVGDVQLRIDNNKAWVISSSETPLDYVPKGAFNNMAQYYQNLPEESRTLIQDAYKETMKATSRAMSPFTATTGEKAAKILQEMLIGKNIKYRTVGLNQAASSIGEYKLDSSLKSALLKCGVKL